MHTPEAGRSRARSRAQRRGRAALGRIDRPAFGERPPVGTVRRRSGTTSCVSAGPTPHWTRSRTDVDHLVVEEVVVDRPTRKTGEEVGIASRLAASHLPFSIDA
jgi:hypothetical protein